MFTRYNDIIIRYNELVISLLRVSFLVITRKKIFSFFKSGPFRLSYISKQVH